MRDFDQDRAARRNRDRSFRLGGEIFTIRSSVQPETLVDYENLDVSDNNKKALEVLDRLVCDFLEDPDGPERYYAIRRRKDAEAIDAQDINELVKWMVETHTGRPTSRPSSSTDGPQITGTSSTEPSLSVVPTQNPSVLGVF